MSFSRHQVTRKDDSQDGIVDALRKAGYLVWIVGRPSDLLVHHSSWGRNRFRMLECKTLSTTGKVKRAAKGRREAQESFIDQTGCEVVGTPEDALAKLV